LALKKKELKVGKSVKICQDSDEKHEKHEKDEKHEKMKNMKRSPITEKKKGRPSQV
jgi:hypothetical protein